MGTCSGKQHFLGCPHTVFAPAGCQHPASFAASYFLLCIVNCLLRFFAWHAANGVSQPDPNSAGPSSSNGHAQQSSDMELDHPQQPHNHHSSADSGGWTSSGYSSENDSASRRVSSTQTNHPGQQGGKDPTMCTIFWMRFLTRARAILHLHMYLIISCYHHACLACVHDG